MAAHGPGARALVSVPRNTAAIQDSTKRSAGPSRIWTAGAGRLLCGVLEQDAGRATAFLHVRQHSAPVFNTFAKCGSKTRALPLRVFCGPVPHRRTVPVQKRNAPRAASSARDTWHPKAASAAGRSLQAAVRQRKCHQAKAHRMSL